MNVHTTIDPVVFRPAVRDHTNLLIAIAGASGTGKTFSALRLARGLVGEKGRIALADTEGGRAKHYADILRFDHGDMSPPYTPARFREVALQVEAAGYDALVVDSMSDEYEGEGGLQDMHDVALLKMARKGSVDELESWQIDKLNAPAWKEPKMAHKKLLMARLRVMRMHLIFCLRAEEKIRFVKVQDDQGRERTRIESAGWVPISEKKFMYDMTVSMVFSPDNPGVPMMHDGKAVYGKIPEHLLFAFEPGNRVSEDTGRRLAEWANGGQPPPRRDIGNGGNGHGSGDDTALAAGRLAAQAGTATLRAWFTALPKADQRRLKPTLESELKAIAAQADAEDVSFDDPDATDNGPTPSGETTFVPVGPAPDAGPAVPADEAAYRAYVADRIIEAEDGNKLSFWFHSDAEQRLREACGVSRPVFQALEAAISVKATELRGGKA